MNRLSQRPYVTSRSSNQAPPWVGDLADHWLVLLGVVLGGLALFDKGFAYIGLPPLFISEFCLILGVGLVFTLGRWRRVFDLTPALWLLALLAWGVLRLVPYLGQYGFSALRDAVLIGYGVLALVLAAVIIEKPTRLATLIRWYRRLTPVLVVGLPLLWLATEMLGQRIATWPWADTAILDVKSGDCLVHLAGVFAFWASGLGWAGLWQLVVLTAGVGMIGTSNRGGLLTFIAVTATCFVCRPTSGAIRGLVISGFVLLVILVASNVSFSPPNNERNVSGRQLLMNMLSIVSEQTHSAGALQDTKQWRLNWWSDIVNYTVLGEYFWTGKGFGVNLADDDGYQVNADESLRSPHSGHMNVLARTGVPGLGLWLASLGSWAWLIGRSFWLARRRGDIAWSRLFLFLGAYWLAFVINASFDVFLEGPMGGIWLWALTGVGLGAVWCYRHSPDVLDQAGPL